MARNLDRESACSRTRRRTTPGESTEPLVWLPTVTGAMKAATAAADPLEEPPGVRAGSWGLAVLPGL